MACSDNFNTERQGLEALRPARQHKSKSIICSYRVINTFICHLEVSVDANMEVLYLTFRNVCAVFVEVL